MKSLKPLTFLLFLPLFFACQKNMVIQQQSSINITNWQLDVTESQFSFVTIKNKTHAEENTIDFADGDIDDKGNVSLALDLASVNTLIERRDERLRNILFKVDQYPVASVNARMTHNLPLEKPVEVTFELNLHGVNKTMTALVMLQKVDQKLVVINYEPVVVNGKDFNLDQAINKLTQIAGLQSINYEVLVDFKLTFEQ